MRSGPVVVVGDVLLDRDIDGTVDRIAPDAPVPVLEERRVITRPGGAALAAALARLAGASVTLIGALAEDAAAQELVALLDAVGVNLVNLGRSSPTPEKIRLRSGPHSIVRLDRNPGGRRLQLQRLPAQARPILAEAGAVLVSDYGCGLAADDGVRACLAGSRVPMVWDPHRLGPAPVPGTLLTTPNARELCQLLGPATPTAAGGPELAGSKSERPGLSALVQQAFLARGRWDTGGVAVTLGEGGALYVGGDGPPLVVPTEPVSASDTCGAGDSFAAAAVVALAGGAVAQEAVVAGVETASRFVASGAAARWDTREPEEVEQRTGTVADPAEDPFELARKVRRAGGTVVAAGGCFDLLHAGHIGLLQDARRLGDCLIVCLNSDASARALKGPGRPIVSECDRTTVLLGLGCVDAVARFDEPTPDAVLDRLRPHVFVKGADYGPGPLREQAMLDCWGGQCILLPYRDGHSTTALVERSRRR